MTVGALPPAAAMPGVTGPVAKVPAPSATAAGGTSALSAGASRGTAPDAASRAAVSFERVLLEQLTTQLAATAAPDDEQGSTATSAYRDLLPRAMADGLAAAGGLGIAAALTPTAVAPTSAAAPSSAATPPTGIPS